MSARLAIIESITFQYLDDDPVTLVLGPTGYGYEIGDCDVCLGAYAYGYTAPGEPTLCEGCAFASATEVSGIRLRGATGRVGP